MLIYISGSEQVTSTTVPGFTGNCIVVSNLLSHSVGNPGQASTGQNVTLFKDRQNLYVIMRNLVITLTGVLNSISFDQNFVGTKRHQNFTYEIC